MSFDELGRPLRDVTFVVVDLETTGAAVRSGAMITEIGAVKVRGGEVLGEFQTLVNPHAQIPPFIAVLTGITNSMVATAPPIESALPAFLEFAHGCVLVAHNAPFDIGFLKHFSQEQGRAWPGFEVLDTARLARRVITRDDAPNC
jgi:DNA polymerase-3 subunit epsilon